MWPLIYQDAQVKPIVWPGKCGPPTLPIPQVLGGGRIYVSETNCFDPNFLVHQESYVRVNGSIYGELGVGGSVLGYRGLCIFQHNIYIYIAIKYIYIYICIPHEDLHRRGPDLDIPCIRAIYKPEDEDASPVVNLITSDTRANKWKWRRVIKDIFASTQVDTNRLRKKNTWDRWANVDSCGPNGPKGPMRPMCPDPWGLGPGHLLWCADLSKNTSWIQWHVPYHKTTSER